jgi:hypothetical protein
VRRGRPTEIRDWRCHSIDRPRVVAIPSKFRGMEDSSTDNCHSLTNVCKRGRDANNNGYYPVESRNIPFFLLWCKRLGDVMVSTNDVTQINNKNLMGPHH